ncbi:transcriptional regulator, TetR family [Leptospira inadai serovar Lyme str. 10]|uniref:Transcriptional regulator, TetR family n=3 Tax=Leptospira inadai TaxID=29506 RepID=V6HE59_9LEPT|nr:transcriptional regulator, TetR family [Leptospira inadai serovar Lyme str. 10]PNV74443.1 AcrR family transcriptional regulator [Leptospira inadai serovar Lyme]
MGEKGEKSRDRMVRAMAEALEMRGYSGTGLNDIVEASGAPKGSIYFHFPGGKEELATEALSISGEEMGEFFQRVLKNSRTAANGIENILQSLETKLIASNFSKGCPISTTANETASENGVVNEVCQNIFKNWNTRLELFLRNSGYGKVRARELAQVLLSLMEGAILLSRTSRDVRPLRSAAKAAKQLLNAGE